MTENDNVALYIIRVNGTMPYRWTEVTGIPAKVLFVKHLAKTDMLILSGLRNADTARYIRVRLTSSLEDEETRGERVAVCAEERQA